MSSFPTSTTALPTNSPAPAKKHSLRLWLWIVIVGLIVIGAWAGRSAYLHYRMNWGVVEPGSIYRSAEIPVSLVRDRIADNHIGVIVFLSNEDDAEIQAEKAAANDAGVKFLNYPMNGDGVAPDPNQYVNALVAVNDAVKNHVPVLVHCHSGAQRTGGVIAMYRLLVQHADPATAYAEMRHYGYDPRRNQALLPFLNQHIDDWAAALVARGVIDRVPDPMPHLTVP